MADPEPRSPALQSLLRSVVRVERATGVAFFNQDIKLIATAWHVVKHSPAEVCVSYGNVTYKTPVLQYDEDADVAILSDDPRLLAPGLRQAEQSSQAAVGDTVHIAGYPSGWPGDSPLLSSGTLAGAQPELWLNADTTWGHSGGPVCLLRDGVPELAGLVLGRAGQVRQDLDLLVSKLTTSAKKLGSAAAQGGGGFAVGTAMGPISFGGIAEVTGHALDALANFSAAHFRTGYTRAADISQLRRLL